MPKARDFAYSTGAAPSGSSKIGNAIVNKPTNGFSGTGVNWWGGPDEDLGYIIAKTNSTPSWTTRISGLNSNIGFSRSLLKSEKSFLELVNNNYNQSFLNGSRAASYLMDNGLWNSYYDEGYVASGLILSLDATNTTSYPGSGTRWNDLSGNGNHGDIVNGGVWSSTFSGDFYFDGSDDRVVTQIGDIGDNATYEAVIYSMGNATTYNMFIGQYLPYIGAFDGNSIVYSDYINGGQTWFKTDPGTITRNQYHHVVCTRYYQSSNNTTYMGIYIDGVLKASSAATGRRIRFSTPENITIGDGVAFNWYTFYGRIPMVRVYNKALTDQEILQNYLYSTRKMYVLDGLSMYIDAADIKSYPDEGTTLYDLSGNDLSVRNAVVRKSTKNGRNALWSNGNDASTATTSVLNTDYHTVELILMFKSSEAYPNGWTGSWEQFFGYYGGGTDRTPGVWRYPTNRLIHWQYAPNYNGPNFGKNSSNEEFDLNTYYHVIVTKDGGTVKTYINGNLTNTVGASNPKTAGTSDVRFFDYYSGDIMEIQMCRIYNRAISDSEARINYNSIKTRL